MIALAVALQAAALDPPVLRPASPRSLSGRFACDAQVYDIALTAVAGQPVRLDRLATNGKPADSGSLAEAARLIARLSDVQSFDVRCRSDGAELSVYGFQRQANAVRRARLRAEWRGTRIDGMTFGVEQR